MNKSWKERPWAAAGLLLLLAVVTHLPALRDGFIWDDDLYVTKNLTLRSLDGLVKVWTEPGVVPQYYPLTHTSFWIEYHLWQLNPFGYHLVNVPLQALNAILLWIVLRRLRIPGAWLAAALFAVHPVNVESVAWIAERKNLLSGAFYLSALLAYLRFLRLDETEVSEPRRWGFYWLAFALFVCALLSKTVTCTLPAAILLLVWWKRGRVGWRDVWPLGPFVAVGAVLGWMTAWIEKHRAGAEGADWSYTIDDRVLIAGRAVWFYAAKLVWPSNLTFIYPRWNIDADQWWQWLFPLAAVAVAVALWAWRKRIGRGPLVAILFFVGTLGPALGFVNVYPMRYSFVADHFQYLACIGLIALVVATGARVLRRRAVRLVLAGGVIVALGIISWQRCAAFHDEETVWRDTLAKNPGCWMAENNLGTVLREQGRTSEAIACFEQALRIKPDSVNAHYNLGKALARQGKLDEGIGHLQEALRLEPGYIDAHIGLADALASAGNVKEAIAHYELVLRAQSGNAIAHYNVARLYATDGNLPEAVAQYREALRLMPDYAHACNNLAWLLATSESSTAPDHAEAIQMATRASELAAGKDPDYLDTLAVAYAAANRFPEAVSTAQKAVELARSSGQPALADEIASRLELYRVGRAYHESVPTTSPQNQRSS